MYENTRVCVFIHCFLVFGCPGETLALVVHILHPNLELLQLLEMMDFSPASEYVNARSSIPKISTFTGLILVSKTYKNY